MAGLDPAIPFIEAQPCHAIGIAGSSPAMTAGGSINPSILEPRTAARRIAAAGALAEGIAAKGFSDP